MDSCHFPVCGRCSLTLKTMKFSIAFRSRSIHTRLAGSALVFFLVSCAPSQDQSELVPLAESQAETVEARGVSFQAIAYADSGAAESVFGSDLRGAGLLPLRLTLQNRSIDTVKLVPRQTFLIDQEGQAWPLLTSDQASKRLGLGVGMDLMAPHKQALTRAESFTGFALDLVTGPGFSKDSQPPRQKVNPTIPPFPFKGLRNPDILAGQSASAVLLFPGRQESHGARGLRLCYEKAGRQAFLTLPLKASPR